MTDSPLPERPGLLAAMDVLEQARGAETAVSVLGRDHSLASLLGRARRLARGLRGRGLGDGSRIALALPNIVDVPLLALAVPMAGARVRVLDPRADASALASQLGDAAADAVATADIGQLFDRVLAAANAAGRGDAAMPVLIARMTEGLPFPRNLLLPLLRGAGLATVPAERRFLRLRDLAAGDATPEAAGDAAVAALGNATLERMAAEIRPQLPGQGAVLFARMTTTVEDLAAMLAIMAEGLTLVLAPRLDDKGLAELVRRHNPALAFVETDTASRPLEGLPGLPRQGA
jgi:acyl-coenzyme A synthetase/AMP-(fatty) acid ligase